MPGVRLMLLEFVELLVFVGFEYVSVLSLERPHLKQKIYRLNDLHFNK